MSSIKLGLIGYGSIGSNVARAVLNETRGMKHANVVLTAVLVRSSSRPEDFPADILFTTNADEFFQAAPQLCVEVASWQAVRQYGKRCLSSGIDMLVTSVSAFCDEELFSSMKVAATAAGSRLLLASGSMPAVDWMHSSSLGSTQGSQTVKVTQAKPAQGFVGKHVDPATGRPVPDALEFEELQTPTTVKCGTAREIGREYPRNTNICVMLAMATAGLDQTEVELIAHPTDMFVHVEYNGAGGSLKLDFHSALMTSLSVLKAIKNHTSPVVFGA
eukprot:TRINITY_DN105800_c0_g1_i1.p1 TRINITY_DN105800_c0_g1~~TRINITY_DN105800_c0_g1_i1.p1  ORF type:complete len:274 (+),score=25.52 TRINITY_DN105800_c0_g1_i1:70-891(+)